MNTDHIEQFRGAMRSAGLIPPDVIKTDGALHRFATSDKRGDDSGWYKLHCDGVPAGAFGDHRSGINQRWSADRGRARLSPAEEAVHRGRMVELSRVRSEQDAKTKVEARIRAARFWALAEPATSENSYLQAKSVQAYGVREKHGAILIPVGNDEGLQSLQVIEASGSKSFLPGGRVKGCYFLIGEIGDFLCVAEGYATGASIHEATGLPVAVAFNAGNMPAVAKAMRQQRPDARIVVCADDDFKTNGNPGLAKARDAAAFIGGYLAVPDFGPDRPDKATDFNDLHQHSGLDAVRACLESASKMEPSQLAIGTAATLATDWPEPQPLDRELGEADAYPLDALPGVIGDAVCEYQAYGQQPVALVASSALAAVSVATQGLANVARDEQLVGPISLSLLVVARSGERKTAADKAFGAPLKDWERRRADDLQDEIKRAQAALAAWMAEDEGLKAAIKSSVARKPERVAELRQRLVEHAEARPLEVAAPRLRYEDVNPQSLPYMLANGYPSAALWSDEGGMVTGSHGMGKDSLLGFLAVLNRLWDGGEIHHDRKASPSVHVEGRRLTVSLMVQPIVLSELTQRGGGLARGSGFLARYLATAPVSTMGDRLYKSPPANTPCMAAFHARIGALLDLELPVDEKGRLNPPVLRLSQGAFSVWRNYHDKIERELGQLGDFTAVRDFAAKSADNASRVAACLHVFGGGQGAIPHDTMERAARLAHWYLREALRMMDALDEPQSLTDARLLDDWLAAYGDCSARDVLQRGPNGLRDKGRRDAAISVLTEAGRARIEPDGKGRRLLRNPALTSAATATPATSATGEGNSVACVASVATVAVASCRSEELEMGAL